VYSLYIYCVVNVTCVSNVMRIIMQLKCNYCLEYLENVFVVTLPKRKFIQMAKTLFPPRLPSNKIALSPKSMPSQKTPFFRPRTKKATCCKTLRAKKVHKPFLLHLLRTGRFVKFWIFGNNLENNFESSLENLKAKCIHYATSTMKLLLCNFSKNYCTYYVQTDFWIFEFLETILETILKI
jgi:hypothetical protein